MHANRYPIAKVWYEAQIVRDRINGRMSTEVILIQAAIIAVMSPTGAGVKNFDKLLKGLRNGN